MSIHTALVYRIIYCYIRGGGQKTKWKTPSPNFEELIESITNMLFFFSGWSRKKSYEVSKLGGGGGGGSWPKNFFLKNSSLFLIFFLEL